MSFLEIACSKAENGSTRCSHTKCSSQKDGGDLTNEKRGTAEAARQSALQILSDALRKNRILMETPKELILQDNGDPKFWMKRFAILTPKLVGELISVLEAVKFKEDLSEKNVFARVYPKSGDKTIYVGPQFWVAPTHLAKDSQPGTLIHEASHFLGIHDITYNEVPIYVGCGGLMVKKRSKDGDGVEFVPLEAAESNANNIEYEFELTLNHKGKYENGKYLCCGETAENSVCERAVPDEFFICQIHPSLSVKKDIDAIVTESLLPATERLKRLLLELLEVADTLDRVHHGATIANITGGAIGIAGGVMTIVGLFLTPFTFGASLALSITGIAASTAGGLTNVVATATDLGTSQAQKGTVENLFKKCQDELEYIERNTQSIREKCQSLEDSGNNGYMYTQIAVGAGEILVNALKLVKCESLLVRASKVALVAGRAAKVLTPIMLGLDIYFITQDSKEIHNGAKTELATKIREAVKKMEGVISHVNQMCMALTASNKH